MDLHRRMVLHRRLHITKISFLLYVVVKHSVIISIINSHFNKRKNKMYQFQQSRCINFKRIDFDA